MKRILFLAVLAASGCASLSADEQAVAANVQKNATAITNFCTNTLAPDLASPLAVAASGVSPDIATAIAGAGAACKSVSAVATSLTTVPWLQDIDTIIKSAGKIVPAPIAPAPVTATSILPGV